MVACWIWLLLIDLLSANITKFHLATSEAKCHLRNMDCQNRIKIYIYLQSTLYMCKSFAYVTVVYISSLATPLLFKSCEMFMRQNRKDKQPKNRGIQNFKSICVHDSSILWLLGFVCFEQRNYLLCTNNVRIFCMCFFFLYVCMKN